MGRQPSFVSLRALEALVRCGSIQKAADDLHVSPGAVSQQIRQLETELGTKLFDRDRRAMKPLPHAIILAREISRAFNGMFSAVDAVRRDSEKKKLQIATLPSVANRVIMPNLTALKKRLGDAQLNFSYIHRVEDTLPSDADIMISVLDQSYEGPGDATVLFPGEVRPYASPAYATEYGPFDTTDEVAAAKLLHDFSHEAWRSWIEDGGGSGAIATNGDVFEDFELLVHAALADQGIALCPTCLVTKEIDLGRLVLLSERAAVKNRSYVVVRKDTHDEVATKFVTWLVETTEHLRNC